MRALMTPELATRGATRAARPACLIVMAPALDTWASGLPGLSNTIRPAMKLVLLIPGALTISPAVSTWAPLWNITPDGFVMTICPLAEMRPAMLEGSGPVTRFSVTALLLGWMNWTAWSRPTSKLRQSMAARWLAWLMVVLVLFWPMLAAPATTWPPWGRALAAGCAAAWLTNTARVAACSAVLRSRLARPRRTVPRTSFAAIERAIPYSPAQPIMARTV